MKKQDMDKAIGHVVKVESRGRFANPSKLVKREEAENHLTDTQEGWGVLTGRTERTQVLYYDGYGYRQRQVRTFWEVLPIEGLQYRRSIGGRWGRDELERIWVESRYVTTMATHSDRSRMSVDEFLTEDAELERESQRRKAENEERKADATQLGGKLLDLVGVAEEDVRRKDKSVNGMVRLNLTVEEADQLVALGELGRLGR